MPKDARQARGPHRHRSRTHGSAPVAVLVPALLAGALLAGCSEADRSARSAVEQAAREAVQQATSQADGTGTDEARQRSADALGDALDSLPGTCSDVLSLPPRTRAQHADDVLRAFWLTDMDADEPPPEAVDAFAEAVVTRCEDSRETAAAVVLREVWETGSYGP